MSDEYPRVRKDILGHWSTIDVTSSAIIPGLPAHKVVPLDAIVIDRSELPEVKIGPEGPYVPAAGIFDNFRLNDWRTARDYIRILLALTEWEDTHPPVDEKDVGVLAGLLVDAGAVSAAVSETEAARRLLATGKIHIDGEDGAR